MTLQKCCKGSYLLRYDLGTEFEAKISCFILDAMYCSYRGEGLMELKMCLISAN